MRLTKATHTILFLLTLGFISTGCAGSTNLGSQDGGSLLREDSASDQMGAQRPPSLVVGSKFIYRDTNVSTGRICRVAMVVEEMKEFEKKPAYWIEVRREKERYFDIYDMNLNWIGSFANGKELESAEPCIRVFDWPLRVGKKWKSDYMVTDYSGGAHLYRERITVNIRRYEEVRVPAGTFRALKIQAGEETLWYAPSIGWAIREQIGRREREGWLLELVEYSIPLKLHPETS